MDRVSIKGTRGSSIMQRKMERERGEKKRKRKKEEEEADGWSHTRRPEIGEKGSLGVLFGATAVDMAAGGGKEGGRITNSVDRDRTLPFLGLFPSIRSLSLSHGVSHSLRQSASGVSLLLLSLSIPPHPTTTTSRLEEGGR